MLSCNEGRRKTLDADATITAHAICARPYCFPLHPRKFPTFSLHKTSITFFLCLYGTLSGILCAKITLSFDYGKTFARKLSFCKNGCYFASASMVCAKIDN